MTESQGCCTKPSERQNTNNGNGNGHHKIHPLFCPLCGGELIYSQGSHDLICERNTLDGPDGIPTLNGMNAPREKDIDPPRGKSCIFAISMTESINSGALFSIRMDKDGVNYPVLNGVMREMQTRKRGQLARTWAESQLSRIQKPLANGTDAKLAKKLGLEVEDVYSIQNSTETVKNLAMYYGLTEGQVRGIKKTALCGTPEHL